MRWTRILLPILVFILALGTAQAQGPTPSGASAGGVGCASVKTDSATGAIRQLTDCGIVDTRRDPETVARSILGGLAPQLGLQRDGRDLALNTVRQTDVATHVRFQQMHKGVPVYLGEVLVQYTPQGKAQWVLNQTIPNLDVDVTPRIEESQALAIATAATPDAARLRAPATAELVIYAEGIAPLLAWHILLPTAAPMADWHVMVAAGDGKILRQWNSIVRDSGSALTYDPNAVQDSGNTSLRDNNHQTSAALDAARSLVTLTDLNPAVRTLKGLYADMTALGVQGCDGLTHPPYTQPYTPGLANEPSRVYSYARNDMRFQEVVAYYAITATQRWIQSLGFANVNNRSIPVNVHCFADDNSNYTSVDGGLHFGDGGVPDAEDADIVVHEYGHAIQDNQVPGWGPVKNTPQRAMGEGFGDFLAGMASISKGNPGYQAGGKYCIGDWDATAYNPAVPNAGGGCLRWINGRNESTGRDVGQYAGRVAEEHDDGRFWSAALTCVYEGMGGTAQARDDVMKLVLQHHFSLLPDSSNNAFDTAVNALQIADTNLFGGAHKLLIRNCMLQRNLIQLPTATTPTITYPAGGEIILPGSTIDVTWAANGAPSDTAHRVEYTSECQPRGDFFDNVENGPDGWSTQHAQGQSNWRIVSDNGHDSPHSWFSPSQASVSDQYLISPPIHVQPGSLLSFWHSYNLEGGGITAYDGGVVEVSADGGATWTDLGPQMTQNGYSGVIGASASNPLAGRSVFSGDSGGWIETRATLGPWADQVIRIRFRQATDNTVARPGWWVDDILVGQPFSISWQPVGVAAPGASSLRWTAPGQSGDNYCVRVRGEGENYKVSAWSTSRPFALAFLTDLQPRVFLPLVVGGGSQSAPTPTPVSNTPTPTLTPPPTWTPLPTPLPTMTPTPSATPSPTPSPTPQGANAPKLTYPMGGETLTAGSAVTVTWQMPLPQPGASFRLEASAACVPSDGFYDNVESGSAGWTTLHGPGVSLWSLSNADAHSPSHSWFARNVDSVSDQFLVSQPITPTTGAELAFWQRYDLEASGYDSGRGYDGGVVEVSVDNGVTWSDMGANFTQNGYNRTISDSFNNPLGGRQAFSGDSDGWIESRADLAAWAGQPIRLRFRLGTDSSTARTGWYVDDIHVGAPFTTTWTPVTVTPPDVFFFAWTTPSQPSDTACVRVRAEVGGRPPSAWSQSNPFRLVAP
ncbi:MAG: immune inhibitor A [Anaerolineae bacterium]